METWSRRKAGPRVNQTNLARSWHTLKANHYRVRCELSGVASVLSLAHRQSRVFAWIWLSKRLADPPGVESLILSRTNYHCYFLRTQNYFGLDEVSSAFMLVMPLKFMRPAHWLAFAHHRPRQKLQKLPECLDNTNLIYGQPRHVRKQEKHFVLEKKSRIAGGKIEKVEPTS